MTAPVRVVTVTVEELGELVEAAVRRALAESAATSSAPAGEWLDAGAAASVLTVNRRTVIKLATSGRLRGSRVGNLWRFRRVDVEGLLEVRDWPARRGA